MIKISKSTDKEVRKFGRAEWPIANVEHYGKSVDYNKKNFVFKATDDGEIVGSIKGSHESGVLYINYLIVANNKKKQGIGRHLIEEMEKVGKKLKAHKVQLITGKDFEAAKFYEALGYKKIAILPKHHFKKDFAVYEKFI
ncbi:GNAT family N-acetyltransferase [Patescibacteria group bacterium]